ncbi:MAG TPA: TetR/AcrR family transcriptional regulator [Candidatus Krumholzibacteria bacterium]|nr:TetR/AcrR family transcriptional regulator [Candidatus Krumholzibacteria bacterium]
MTTKRKKLHPAGPLPSDELPHLKGLGRRERRAAETRVKLFRSALQLFAEHGFGNVTVEEITELADVGKGTFFNYFKSKDHVFRVMAEIQLGKVREALEAAESGKPTRSILRSLFTRIAEEPGRSPALARAVVAAFVSSSIREQVAHDMAEGRRLASRILQLGQARGEIDSTLKPEQMALHLQEAFIGTMLMWSMTGEQKLEKIVERSFRHFWSAIASRKGSS